MHSDIQTFYRTYLCSKQESSRIVSDREEQLRLSSLDMTISQFPDRATGKRLLRTHALLDTVANISPKFDAFNLRAAPS
jgi:hypothetical protein